MRGRLLTGSLYGAVMTLGLGLGSAQAFVAAPNLATVPESLVTPAAMCGVSCRSGGRYIPGPPAVCRANGLRYCGPSGGAVVVPPVVVAPRLVAPRRDRVCRTTTVRRPNGTVRTTRVCD